MMQQTTPTLQAKQIILIKCLMLGMTTLATAPQLLWAKDATSIATNSLFQAPQLSPVSYSCSSGTCTPNVIRRTAQCAATSNNGISSQCQATNDYYVNAYFLDSNANCDATTQVITTTQAALTPYTVNALYIASSTCAQNIPAAVASIPIVLVYHGPYGPINIRESLGDYYAMLYPLDLNLVLNSNFSYNYDFMGTAWFYINNGYASIGQSMPFQEVCCGTHCSDETIRTCCNLYYSNSGDDAHSNDNPNIDNYVYNTPISQADCIRLTKPPTYTMNLPLTTYYVTIPDTTTIGGVTYYYCGNNSSRANKKTQDTCLINGVQQSTMTPCSNIWNSYSTRATHSVAATSYMKQMTLTAYETITLPYSTTSSSVTTIYYCGNKNTTATGSGKANNDLCYYNNQRQNDLTTCDTAYNNGLTVGVTTRGNPGIAANGSADTYAFTVDLLKTFTPQY